MLLRTCMDEASLTQLLIYPLGSQRLGHDWVTKHSMRLPASIPLYSNLSTGHCDFIHRTDEEMMAQVHITAWGHTDAKTDPGFNRRPLGVIVCVLHPPQNDLVLEQFSRGQCEDQDALLVRHWYDLSTHAARHGGVTCHHQNVPSQWVWIWWLSTRKNKQVVELYTLATVVLRK